MSKIIHEIPVTSVRFPFSQEPIHIRYPESHKEEVNSQINKMLKENVIKPFSSLWS